MNKKPLALSFILIGVSLVVYGLVKAPISNAAQIRDIYGCNTPIKNAFYTYTDSYCYDVASAPEAKKDFGNTFVYNGLAVIVLGSLYLVIILNKK